MRQIQVKLFINTNEVQIAEINFHLTSLSEHFYKWNKVTFSSLSDINRAVEICITITWNFVLYYVITTASLWCWKKISYNDVTSMSIRNLSTSRWKPNKKLMLPQYRVNTGLGQQCLMVVKGLVLKGWNVVTSY